MDEDRIARRRRILDTACVGNGSFLDVGAGPLGLIAAKEYGCTVTTIDNSEEKIREVSEEASKQGVSVKFELGDASRMPYPDSFFDYVVCLGTLHHVPVSLRQAVVKECLRTAGKKAVFAEYTKEGFGRIHPEGEHEAVDIKWLEDCLGSLGSFKKKELGDMNVYVMEKT